MPPKTKITLTDAQKYEFCLYAHHTPGTELSMLTGLKTNGTPGLANLQYHEYFRKRRSDFRLRLMHRKQKDIDQYFNKL